MSTPVRLAVGFDGRRSRYWTFNTTSGSPGVYIGREDLAGMAHLSLHGDRQWHLSAAGRNYLLPVADLIGSTGARHAVRVLVYASACQLVTPPGKAELLELDSGERDVSLAIDLFVLSAGGHVIGQTDSGFLPRWQLPMPDGYDAQIVAQAVRAQPLPFRIDAPPDTYAAISAGLQEGQLDQMLVLGSANGGPITIIDADIQPTA